MNNFLLALEVDATKPLEGFSDKLIFGGRMLLTGMLAVFLVLGIIWLALTLFKFFFTQKKPKKPQEAIITPAQIANDISSSSDGEIIAAIACAIAYAESESQDTKFRVVSFKKR